MKLKSNSLFHLVEQFVNRQNITHYNDMQDSVAAGVKSMSEFKERMEKIDRDRKAKEAALVVVERERMKEAYQQQMAKESIERAEKDKKLKEEMVVAPSSIKSRKKRFKIDGYGYIQIQMWIGAKNSLSDDYDIEGSCLNLAQYELIKKAARADMLRFQLDTTIKSNDGIETHYWSNIKPPFSPYSDAGQAWLTVVLPFVGKGQRREDRKNERLSEALGAIPPDVMSVELLSKSNIPTLKDYEKEFIERVKKTSLQKIADGISELEKEMINGK